MNPAVAARFNQIALSYDQHDQFLREIGRRLLSRMAYIRHQPRMILDMGAGTGFFSQCLREQFPKARVVACDCAPAMLEQAKLRRPLRRKTHFVCADAQSLPFMDHTFDLIFANLLLPWVQDVPAMFHEFRRVLTAEGCLLWTSLGPDTLKEAKHAWAEVDRYIHINDFTDMHDLGDVMVHAGLVDPVTDAEWLTVHYTQARYVLEDVKRAGSVVLGRSRPGLTGPQTWQRFEKAYEAFRDGSGKLPVTFEVIYGHAWGNALPVSTQSGTETLVPITSLTRRRNTRA